MEVTLDTIFWLLIAIQFEILANRAEDEGKLAASIFHNVFTLIGLVMTIISLFV